MTSNATSHNRLASVLALTGASLAVAAVIAAYTLQNYWGMEGDWLFLHSRTNRALLVSGILMALALLVKRWTDTGLPRRSFCLRSAGYLFLLLSAALVAQTVIDIRKKLQFQPLPVDARYKFSTDGVSANAPAWSKHLQGLTGKAAVHGLEIGSYQGRSALWFLENILTHDSAIITCIDLFEDDFEATFDANVKASGLGHKLIKVKGMSATALRTLKTDFDFIYIDGSHVAKDVLVDAVLAWDLLKPGGLMIFDDYGMRRRPADNQSAALIPEPAIDAFLNVFRHYIDVVHRDYQIIIKKKIQPDFNSKGILETLKSIPF